MARLRFASVAGFNICILTLGATVLQVFASLRKLGPGWP